MAVNFAKLPDLLRQPCRQADKRGVTRMQPHIHESVPCRLVLQLCGSIAELRRTDVQGQERNSTTRPPGVTWQQDGIVFAHADMSGASCCQRLIRPAIAAPRMGASQNSQSCAM